MNINELNKFLNEIKENSYWKVIIRPQIFKEDRISEISELKKIIENNNVRIRGWNYPHLNRKNIIFGNDFLGSCVEFLQIKEIWRFYLSGQFENYFAFWEDMYKDKQVLKQQVINSLFMFSEISNKNFETDKFMEIDSTIYRIAEIFTFALNLAQKEILGENIVMEIKLLNNIGRILFIWDFGRELYGIYESGSDIEIKRQITKSQLIGENDQLIVNTVLDIFHRFGWINVDSSLIINILNKFKNKRF